MELLDRAFAPDIRVAFEGSIDLAKSCGVPVDEILDSKEIIASFLWTERWCVINHPCMCITGPDDQDKIHLLLVFYIATSRKT